MSYDAARAASGVGADHGAGRKTAEDPAPPVRWTGRQWALLTVLSGNMLLDAVEVSVLFVALPVIADRLGLPLGDVQWLMSGFALGFAALLMLGAPVTARLGRRGAYLTAMAGFGLASVAGGLAGSLAVLIVVRVVKGCCAALTAPAGLAIITEMFPEGAQRRRAVSVYAFCGAIGFTTGLLLAGLLTTANWHAVFVFPAPLAVLLLIGGLYSLPRDLSRGPGRRPRLAVLDNHDLRYGAVVAATLNGTYQSLLILLVFRVHDTLNWSSWTIALGLLPACVPLVLAVPFAGRLIARYGTGRLIVLGAVFPLLASALCLARPDDSRYVTGVLPVLLLVEAGFCCSFTALNMQATATVPATDRGDAVSVYQTCVQLGAGLLVPAAALLSVHGGARAAFALVTAVTVAGLAAALCGIRTVPR
jgi:MFS family permease